MSPRPANAGAFRSIVKPGDGAAAAAANSAACD
jgi:hypothetical protein